MQSTLLRCSILAVLSVATGFSATAAGRNKVFGVRTAPHDVQRVATRGTSLPHDRAPGPLGRLAVPPRNNGQG